VLAVGAAAAAGLIAGCSGSKPLRLQVRSGVKVARGDVAILNGLLDIERHTIAAYTAGIPLLRRPAAKAAQQFLSQELAHAQSIADLIKQAGGKAAKPRARYDLGNPKTEPQVLALLEALEGRQLAAYVQKIPGLSPGRLRSAVAAIFANDAQHLAVLRTELRQDPVPAAFVSGG
jgi:ferritin-like protein